MTTEENEPQIPFDPLLASIFTAMANDSAHTTNTLLDIKDREIAELQKNYVALFESIDNANLKIDSLTIDRILYKHGLRVSFAQEALLKTAN